MLGAQNLSLYGTYSALFGAQHTKEAGLKSSWYTPEDTACSEFTQEEEINCVKQCSRSDKSTDLQRSTKFMVCVFNFLN